MSNRKNGEDEVDNPYAQPEKDPTGEALTVPVVESSEEESLVYEDEDGEFLAGTVHEVVIVDPAGARRYVRVKKVRRSGDGRPILDLNQPLYNCSSCEKSRNISPYSTVWCVTCQKLICVTHCAKFLPDNNTGKMEAYCIRCFWKERVKRFVKWIFSVQPPE